MARGCAGWACWTIPQILVNPAAQTQFMQQVAAAGRDGASYLEAARVSLVGAIHDGQIIVLAIAILSLWFVRRVPPDPAYPP